MLSKFGKHLLNSCCFFTIENWNGWNKCVDGSYMILKSNVLCTSLFLLLCVEGKRKLAFNCTWCFNKENVIDRDLHDKIHTWLYKAIT